MSNPVSSLLAFHPDRLVFVNEAGMTVAPASASSPAFFSASFFVLNCSPRDTAIFKVRTDAPSGRASVRPNHSRIPPKGSVEVVVRIKLDRAGDARNVSWRFQAVWAADPGMGAAAAHLGDALTRNPDAVEWARLWRSVTKAQTGRLKLDYEFADAGMEDDDSDDDLGEELVDFDEV